MFVTLMVDASGSPPAPSRGLSSMFLSVDGVCFWMYSSGTSQGAPPSTFLTVDGGRSQISNAGTSQGARRRHFLALMVDAPGSIAPAPPRETVVDVF
jgi:hypothetical protein